MSQVLHIFRKDSRRFWPEILITLTVTAGFVAVIPGSWQPRGSDGGPQVLIQAFRFLVVIAWCLLITRVVHAESLIGEDRAWLTRPYEWPKLLAAKLLFVATYLCVPLLIAQCILLRVAGFHPLWSLHGLLYNLGQLALFLLLPLFTIAVVTANFARTTLTSLGILVGFIGLTIFSQWQGYREYDDQWPSIFWLLLCAAACCTAIVLQYATRRTLFARLLLIAVFAATAIVEYALPHSVDVSKFYASRSSAFDLDGHISAADRNHQSYSGGMDTPRRKGIQIPIQVTGLPDGYVVELDDVQSSIDAPGGFHWESPWRGTNQVRLGPGANSYSSVNLWIDTDVFNRLKTVPIDLHLNLTVTLLQTGATTQLPLAAQEFTVPEFGICAADHRDDQTYLRCRSPLRKPPLTLVSSRLSETPCSGYRPHPDVASSNMWIGDVNHTPADFSIAPISVFDQNFGGQTVTRSDPPSRMDFALCPGTPITYTQFHMAGRTHVELSIHNMQLPEPGHSPASK